MQWMHAQSWAKFMSITLPTLLDKNHCQKIINLFIWIWQPAKDKLPLLNYWFIVFFCCQHFLPQYSRRPSSICREWWPLAVNICSVAHGLPHIIDRDTIVLFTYGERLTETTIDEFIWEDRNLQRLVKKSGGGYHLFRNHDTGTNNQVRELLEKIETRMKNKNSWSWKKADLIFAAVLMTVVVIYKMKTTCSPLEKAAVLASKTGETLGNGEG